MEKSYKIKKINTTVFSAEKITNNNIHHYEWKQSQNGWWITREVYAVENNIPQKSEIWVPDEIIDSIIVESTKNNLIS